MTDHEAMKALAEPAPEVGGSWYGVEGDSDPHFRSNPADCARWQEWRDRYNAAVAHVRGYARRMT